MVLAAGLQLQSQAAAQQVRVQTEGEELEPGPGPGPEPEPGLALPSASLEASGQVSWLVKYGLGDPRGLTERGYANQLLLEQALSVDAQGGVEIGWPLAGKLEILAHLDNQLPENLQVLAIRYRGRGLEGEFGDFTIPGNTQFTSYGRTLKGLQLNFSPSESLEIKGVFSWVEGLPQTKVFRGNTAPAEVLFSLRPPEQPWLEQPYLTNIRGLEWYKIEGFVPGFTKLYLLFEATPELGELLARYELGYLLPTIEANPRRELDSAYYVVVARDGEGDREQYLLLKREALDLLRGALKDYIEDYNEAHQLTGEERKRYPLGEGTRFELSLLEALMEDYAKLELEPDGRELELGSYQQERFYWLGQTQIDPDSVVVEVMTEEGFTSVDDPSLVGYSFHLFPEEGIIELEFPPEFFAELEQAQVRVSYSYAVTGGMYVLGLSIVRGSEKVYLNGKLLQRDLDYTIDYETGALVLFQPLGPEDELKIEYEIYRGGLGGYTEYKRGLAGILISYRPSEELALSLDLLRAADSLAAGAGVDRTRLRVMPNDHLVGGLSGRLTLGGLEAALELAYNYNRFPPGENQRRNLPNRINAIRAIRYSYGGREREYVLFGHQNGLTVFDPARSSWQSFGPAEGLAGRSVRDIAWDGHRTVVFATDGGISVVELEGEDPFALLVNWRRFYTQDGLVSQNVYAALIHERVLYLGTDRGLNRVPLRKLEDKASWASYTREGHPEMVSDRVLELAEAGGLIYIGTDRGLMIFDPQTEKFTAPAELAGARITALFADGGEGEEVLVATEVGVRVFSGGQGSGWLTGPPTPAAINSLAVTADGTLWYGTDEGLYRAGSESPLIRAEITALAPAGDGGLWVGPEATSEYELPLWRVSLKPRFQIQSYPQRETHLSGRDEHRFGDIPAKEHTDRGWVGTLTITQKLGKLKLIGTLQRLSPEFTPLGGKGEGRHGQDVKRWSLRGEWALAPGLRLSAEHEARLEGAELARLEPSSRRRSYLERDVLELGWSGLKLDYALERIDDRGQGDGFDRARGDLTLALNGSLGERLGLSLSYERLDSFDLKRAKLGRPRSSQEHELTGELRFRLLPELELSLSYSRPWKVIRYGTRKRSWGTEGLGFAADWSGSFPWGSLEVSYSRDARRRLPAAERAQVELTDRGQVELRLEGLQVGTARLYPRGTVSFERKGPQLELAGEGSLRGELGQLNSQLGCKLTATLDERTRRGELVGNLSLRVGYEGLKEELGLSPALSLQGTIKLLSHPIYGRRAQGNWTAGASLTWTPTEELSSSLTLSRTRVKNDRENTTSWSVRGLATLKPAALPELSLSLEATASYLVGQQRKEPQNVLKGELVLKSSYELRGNWEATGLVGYLLNVDNLEREGTYQSLYLSAQLGTSF